MINRKQLILGTAALALLSAPVMAKKKTYYVTGGSDKTITIEQKDKTIKILPQDGGELKPPPKYTAPKKYTPPERFTPPPKYQAPKEYTKPFYND